LEALWPGTYVTEGVLKTHVNEVRRALGDDAREPRFLATVHRRGYRFICDVLNEPALERAVPAADRAVPDSLVAPVASPPASAPREDFEALDGTFVGRATEVARLEAALESALSGRRRFVFVAGEAGIGKTTLVDFFLTARASPLGVAVGR